MRSSEQQQILNVREFSKGQEEATDKEEKFHTISGVLGFICCVALFILLYVLINRSLDSLYALVVDKHSSDVVIITRDQDLPPVGEHIYQPFTSYRGSDSHLFHVKQGELELYATVNSEGNTLFVFGQEYHAGGQLLDGTIRESFTYDSSIDKYVNESQTIFISDFDGRQFKIEDKRDTVCLPFNGTLVVQ